MKFELINSDALTGLKHIPNESVDCIVTSPPYYGGLRDYGDVDCIWDGDLNCEHDFSDPVLKGGRIKRDQDLDRKHSEIKENQFKEKTYYYCSKCHAWRGQLGHEPHPDLYVEHLRQIFFEAKRVLKPEGSLFLNLGDAYYGSWGNYGSRKGGQRKVTTEKLEREGVPAQSFRPPTAGKEDGAWLQDKQLLGMPWRVAAALQEDGWILRNSIIWSKINHMPSSVNDRFTNAYEFIFFFVKNKKYYFDLTNCRVPHKESSLERVKYDWNGSRPEGASFSQMEISRMCHPLGKNPGDVWEFPTESYSGSHFAVFPSELPRRCLKAACPKEICIKCGKARERLIIKEEVPFNELPESTKKAVERAGSEKGNYFGNETKDYETSGAQKPSETKKSILKSMMTRIKTVGWSDCGCNAGWVNGTVLDMFVGSGTTLQVARELCLNGIGIEKNAGFIPLIKERVSWGTGFDIEWKESKY